VNILSSRELEGEVLSRHQEIAQYIIDNIPGEDMIYSQGYIKSIILDALKYEYNLGVENGEKAH
jgi:hypothetical protein